MSPLAVAGWILAIAAGISIADDWAWWLRVLLIVAAIVVGGIEAVRVRDRARTAR